MDVKAAARLYNLSDYQVVKEIISRNDDDDKRYMFLIKFADNQEVAIKICRNDFTTHERVFGWQKLCEEYLKLGIYCPRIIDSINCKASETIINAGEEFIVFAEEVMRYKTYEELIVKPNFETIKPTIIESIGKVAANCHDRLPFPSVFCIYDTFDATYTVDENYENAENFCKTAKEYFAEHSEYIDKIWSLFLQKRKDFEPVYRLLPKASFQSDLNRSNILIDDMRFAGYIDFNLSGTAVVLSYIIINEVCGYRLRTEDLEYLMDENFLKNCDDYLYENLKIISRNYKFSDYEKENICLCYNTVYPFCCWSINALLNTVVEEGKFQYVKSILDWVYYQLNRSDIKLKDS